MARGRIRVARRAWTTKDERALKKHSKSKTPVELQNGPAWRLFTEQEAKAENSVSSGINCSSKSGRRERLLSRGISHIVVSGAF